MINRFFLFWKGRYNVRYNEIFLITVLLLSVMNIMSIKGNATGETITIVNLWIHWNWNEASLFKCIMQKF